MGQIGECIVSDKLHGLVPQSFATSYLVHSNEDVRILHELVSAHGELHLSSSQFIPDVKQ